MIRGRPPIPPDEKITENGLFAAQWERIQKDAKSKGVKAAMMLRHIVKTYYFNIDLQAEQAKGLPPEILAEIDKEETKPQWKQEPLL